MFALNIAEGVATLTLSRPPVNAISEEWLRRFDGELDGLVARDDWKVLFINFVGVVSRPARSVCSLSRLRERGGERVNWRQYL